METVFLKVFNMGFTASWLILAVLLIRFMLKKAPKWISCLLWALVAFKLICPFSIESALSLIPSSEPLPEQIITGNTFRVNTGIGAVDAPVNTYLGDHYYEGVSVPADNGNHVMYVLGILWLIGIVLFLLYGFVSYYRLYRITRVSLRLEENIFLCDAIDTPFILGVVKPRIYLPSGMEKEQAAYVVSHERVHLKRRDHWWKPLGFLILSVYWFWPLCWISYVLFCRDIELACDERVIRELGQESKKPYAEALVACSVKQGRIAACPLAFGETDVKERVKNVLSYKKPALWIILVAILCCIAAAIGFLTNPKETGEGSARTEEDAAMPEEESAESSRASEDTEDSGAWYTKETYQGEAAKTVEETTYDMLTRWRMMFCARDVEAIADMVTPELAEEILMGSEGDYSFGFSSPWPWDWEVGSHIYEYDEESAVIYYYAMTSDPHVTCWREELEYKLENDSYVITKEKVFSYDNISEGEEFEKAYHGSLDGTMMDYTKNGLGETLNENALLSSSMAYRDLFEPESAAVFLLNLSDDPEKVQYTLHEPEGDGLIGLEIHFLEDEETFTISMVQPYGGNGIWVPADYRVDVISRMMKIDREEWRKLRFTYDIQDTSKIACIGEIPEQGIRLYGYNDEEVGGRGVALEIGEDIYYFDWFYTSPQMILPALYWDEGQRQLQISCHVYTGTGVSADELHVLQQYDTGTLSESRFSLEDYEALLRERISWNFDEKTRKLVLTDAGSGEEVASVMVPEETGEKVTGLELGMISGFELGKEIYFRVSPGYYPDGRAGVAEYEGLPDLRFEVVTVQGEYGEMKFELGRRIQ